MFGLINVAFLVVVVLLSFAISNAAAAHKDPDEGLNMTALVTRHGYTIEEHFVTTSDGYILGMFRIPHGRNNSNSNSNSSSNSSSSSSSSSPSSSKTPVLLQHALLDSSFAYVCNLPNESLGYILADAGFDVWFGNNRGNKYSTNHTTLSTDSREFWEFTYDDMALKDLPAEFDYITSVTGAEQISYVGHSEGTIQAFAGFSRNQTLAKMTKVFVALAPVAYVYHIKSLFTQLMCKLDVDELFVLFGDKAFLPSSSIISKIAPGICNTLPSGCADVLELIVGPGRNINKTRLPVLVGQTPSGTSVQNMIHWCQGMRHNVFEMYDYGSRLKNMKHYNQTTPPPYKLADVNVPTVLLSGGHDYLADPTDVKLMLEQLRTDVVIESHVVEDYAHLDFTWGVDAAVQVYTHVIDHL